MNIEETNNQASGPPPEPTQPKAKAGRPKGSKNLRTREAARVLAQLGFDPIAEKVRLFDECTREIIREQRKEKPNLLYIAQLLATKDKCSTDLLRFGYSRATETQEIEHKAPAPVAVVMTPKGWKPGDPVPGQLPGNTGEGLGESQQDNDLYEYPEYGPRMDPAEGLPDVTPTPPLRRKVGFSKVDEID
jgi:hypothetical protein